MHGQMGVFEHVGIGDGSVLMSAQIMLLVSIAIVSRPILGRSSRFESFPLDEL